jgi:DNA-binding response OmpR family regulator
MDAKKQRRASYALREAMLALTPPVVVVAEDDAEIRRVVTMALRLDGYSVVEALDGAHLVEHIGSARLFGNVHGGLDPIGLVISDIRMGGKSGLDVLAQLRAEEISVGMILMTAYPDPSVRAQAERLGAAAFLPKPFEIDDLLGLVRGILRGKRTPAGSAAPGRAAAETEGQVPPGAPRAYHFRHM